MNDLIRAYEAQCELWNDLCDSKSSLRYEEGIANEYGWDWSFKARAEAEVADLEDRIAKNNAVIRDLMMTLSNGGRL